MRSLKDKFAYAFVGLKKGVLEDRSVKLQCFIAALVILFCLFLPLARWEWGIVLLLCIDIDKDIPQFPFSFHHLIIVFLIF